MNIEQLKYIVEVARKNTLAEASKTLHISQSALSQSITNIEQALGITIFERGRQGTFPTEIGEEILQKSVDILQLLKELEGIAKRAKEATMDSLTIGTVAGAAMYLPKLLALYKQRYPNLQIQMIEQSSEKIIESIKEGVIDIGFVGLTRQGKEQLDVDLYIDVLLRGKMVVAVNQNTSYAHAKQITPEQLRGEPIVLYNDDRMWEFVEDFTSFFGPLNILFSTNNMDAIRNAVVENIAMTIGPDYTILNDPAVHASKAIILPIENYALNYPGMAIVTRRNSQSTFLRDLIQDMKQQLQSFQTSM